MYPYTSAGQRGSCDHIGIVVVPIEHGYQTHCLKCDTVGPEREDPMEAWKALAATSRSDLSEPRV